MAFIAAFHPELEHLHPYNPRKLVLDEVLATIPSRVSALKKLIYTTYVKLDQALQPVAPSGALRLNNAASLPFFQSRAWNRFDHTVARLANVRDMRVLVNITGFITPETKAVYDPQHMFYDSVDMGSSMEDWGQNMFVETRMAPRADITVFGSIGHGGLIDILRM